MPQNLWADFDFCVALKSANIFGIRREECSYKFGYKVIGKGREGDQNSING